MFKFLINTCSTDKPTKVPTFGPTHFPTKAPSTKPTFHQSIQLSLNPTGKKLSTFENPISYMIQLVLLFKHWDT